MRIKILTIGKLKNKNLLNEVNDLVKRIKRLEIVELKEIKENNVDILKNKEGELILNYIDKSYYNVLLWEFGKELSTKDFYDKFDKIDRDICFIITGAYGPSEELKMKVDYLFSLSKMTFTHEQAFYMLIEQIYRMECFRNGIPYTK